MELKDVILSTLAEMEDTPAENKISKETPKQNGLQEQSVIKEAVEEIEKIESNDEKPENELLFLNSIRERLLVLFEGFQAPNNSNIEAKIDMTLNFLEYVLAMIDNRLESLKKGK